MIVVKPPSVKRGVAKSVMSEIMSAGLNIVEVRRCMLTAEQALSLYSGHIGKDYYGWLLNQITSGDCVAYLIEGHDAGIRARNLAGPTKPEKARQVAPESIRARLTPPEESYELSRKERRAVDNVVHTPDPEEPGAMERETNIFFPDAF